MMSTPRTLIYRGATYTCVSIAEDKPGLYEPQELQPYEDLVSYGNLEIGDVLSPEGKWYPGWADIRGRKYAEVSPPVEMRKMLPVTQFFLRIDDRPGWKWKWMEGADQEDVNETFQIHQP